MLLEKYENLLELSVNRSSHQRCTVKKVFSEIRRTHRETSVPESLLIKLQALGPQLYLKRDSGTGVYLWILRNF